MTRLGDSLDLPFEDVPGGPLQVPIGNAQICGGIVVKAVKVPVGRDTFPGLIFQFYKVDGIPATPVLLVADPDQMRKLVPLVSAAVDSSIAAVSPGGGR